MSTDWATMINHELTMRCDLVGVRGGGLLQALAATVAHNGQDEHAHGDEDDRAHALRHKE